MKMKNLLITLIAVAMVFTITGVVSADEHTYFGDGNHPNPSVVVNYSLGQSYTVSIPSEVNINGRDGDVYYGTGIINVTRLLINDGDYLHVKLQSLNSTSSAGIYKLVNSQTSEIRYYINKTVSDGAEESPVRNTADILVAKAGEAHPLITGSGTASIGNYTTLKFNTTTTFIKEATKSGYHQDVLSFTFYINKLSEYLAP